jgi:hypothetical protein
MHQAKVRPTLKPSHAEPPFRWESFSECEVAALQTGLGKDHVKMFGYGFSPAARNLIQPSVLASSRVEW